MTLRFRSACFLFSSALLAFLLPAMVAAAPPSRFSHLSVEQGLSQSTVQAILQDRAGFLWFGTEEGLDRYDGYSFVLFKHNPRDPKSLPDDLDPGTYVFRVKASNSDGVWNEASAATLKVLVAPPFWQRQLSRARICFRRSYTPPLRVALGVVSTLGPARYSPDSFQELELLFMG